MGRLIPQSLFPKKEFVTIEGTAMSTEIIKAAHTTTEPAFSCGRLGNMEMLWSSQSMPQQLRFLGFPASPKSVQESYACPWNQWAKEIMDHVAKDLGDKTSQIKNVTAFIEDLARRNCYSTVPGQQSLRKQSARILQHPYCTMWCVHQCRNTESWVAVRFGIVWGAIWSSSSHPSFNHSKLESIPASNTIVKSNGYLSFRVSLRRRLALHQEV